MSRNITLFAVVLALAALLFLARLGTRALWSEELRWAEIPREMVRSGDYFRPTINGHEYYDKPLGSYWLVLGAAWLTGDVDEGAARLPCALSGLLAVALLMLLARRLYDVPTAALAGLVLATSFSFVFFARHASADLETVAGELAALLLFLRNEERPRGWWVLFLWLIMALTSLTKGLLGFALPLAVLGTWSCLPTDAAWWQRFRWLLNGKTLLAAALAVAVYLAPFAVSIGRTGSWSGLELVYRENVQRFFSTHNHRGPVYLYAYVIFGLLAPWSVFLPAALVRAHGQRGDRFALVYFWATFVFFTLSSSRRSYYLVPILPAAALLIARLLLEPSAALSRMARLLRGGGFLVLAASVLLGTVALLPASWALPAPWSAIPPAPYRAVLALGLLACVFAVVHAFRGKSPQRFALASGAIAYFGLAYFFLAVLPAADAYRDEKDFAERVRVTLGDGPAGLALYRTREPVYYLGFANPLPEYDEGGALDEALRAGEVRWLVGRRRDLEPLGLTASVLAEEASYPWEPPARRQDKLLLLELATRAR